MCVETRVKVSEKSADNCRSYKLGCGGSAGIRARDGREGLSRVRGDYY